MTTTASPASISPAKLRANRANARKSTGPRTPQGKSRACLNALSHGLCSAGEIILPHENQADFHSFRDDLLEDLNPTDSVELAIAQRMIHARWKLRRVHDAELTRHQTSAQTVVRYRENRFLESPEYYALNQPEKKAAR